MPELDGLYFYGDYVNGIVWIAWRDEAGAWQSETFMDTAFVIPSFGEDEQGELYLVDYKGAIYRLEHAAEQPRRRQSERGVRMHAEDPAYTSARPAGE